MTFYFFKVIFLLGSIKIPFFLLVITSGIPSIFEAITGVLQSPASTLTMPNGSLIEGTIKILNFNEIKWI